MSYKKALSLQGSPEQDPFCLAVQDSTLNRFLWVLSYFANRGFYVVLVHQTNNDGIAASSPAQWLQSWRWLMQ